MKKLRKALSLLLAGVTAVTAMLCGSVSASAASDKTALMKTAITQIDTKATGIDALGQDLYLFGNDSYRAVYRIDSTALKNWRSTGKLSAKKMKITSDINDYVWYYDSLNNFTQGNYAVFSYTDKNNVKHCAAVKYDKSKGTIKQYYTTTNYLGSTGDGYLSDISCSVEKKTVTLKIIDPNGKKVKTLTRKFTDNAFWSSFEGNRSYVVITTSKINDDLSSTATVEFIDKTGKVIKTLKNKNVGLVCYGENYFAYAPHDVWARITLTLSDVYITDKSKLYALKDKNYIASESENEDTTKPTRLYDLGKKIYGTKAIARYISANQENSLYGLIDVASKGVPEEYYDQMFTGDNGKTFLVKNSEGQWGYLDSKGKKLAMFDDAGAFSGNGKYAPVIKDGKIYLVNKSMKQISKTIKADKNSSVVTISDELFGFIYGGKLYLMTNKT